MWDYQRLLAVNGTRALDWISARAISTYPVAPDRGNWFPGTHRRHPDSGNTSVFWPSTGMGSDVPSNIDAPCFCPICTSLFAYYGNSGGLAPLYANYVSGSSSLRYMLEWFFGRARTLSLSYVWLLGPCQVADWSDAAIEARYAAAIAEENRLMAEERERRASVLDSEECDESYEGFDEGPPVREGRGRMCGVEWEFNSLSTPGPLRKWATRNGGGIHSDGSCGWEAVTPPLGGKAVARVLTELATAFDDGEASIDSRCGIHVHVDARDMNWDDMYRFLRVWSIVEDAMFLLGGQARSKSHYCQPCGQKYANALDAADVKGAVLAVAYGARYPKDGRAEARAVRNWRHSEAKKHGGRYKAINLCPWLAGRSDRPRKPDSTIEFRLHRNSGNGWRVVGWAHLCITLVDWAVSHTDSDVEKLSRNGLRALCQIAPHLAGYIVRRVKAWRKACPRRKRAFTFRGGRLLVDTHRRGYVCDDEDDGDMAAAE